MAPQRVRLAPVRIVASLLAACALAACAPPGRDLQPGAYRAVVDSPGGDLPFGLDVAKQGASFTIVLVNGEERLPVTGLRVGGGRVTMSLPGGASTLTGTISGGEIRGDVDYAGPGGRRHKVPFKATLGQTWQFYAEPTTDHVDAAGRWAVTFTDEQGATIHGVAELQQRFHRVTAVVRTPSGDVRLDGEVHGDELLLSRFDGRIGQLLLAKVNKRGELEGETWTLPAARQRFIAVRNADAAPEATPAAAAP